MKQSGASTKHEHAQQMRAAWHGVTRSESCYRLTGTCEFVPGQKSPLVVLQVSASTAVPEFLSAAEQLVAPVDAFFELVFVMAEDEAVRRNRLALLRYDMAAGHCTAGSYVSPASHVMHTPGHCSGVARELTYRYRQWSVTITASLRASACSSTRTASVDVPCVFFCRELAELPEGICDLSELPGF